MLTFEADKYSGQWVALDPVTDQVISQGDSIAVVVRDARKKGIREPIVYAVPKSDAYFIGGT